VQQHPRRAVTGTKEYPADTVATHVGCSNNLPQNLKVACHDYVAQSKNPKANNRTLVEPERIPRFVIAKVAFRGIKKGFDFHVASHPLGASHSKEAEPQEKLRKT
jgi:hypothetical protein